MEVEREQLFEKLLSDNLARAIAWVSYAEAKNLALLTFCSAWIVALFVFATDADGPWSLFKLGSWTALIPFSFGALVSVCSFLPKTDPPSSEPNLPGGPNANLLFFGDLASVAPDQAGLAFRSRYFAPNGSLSDDFIRDIGVQFVAISRIAKRKFGMFDLAYEAVVAALAVMAMFAIAAFIGRTG